MSLLDDVKSKKDEIIEKAKQLKDEHDARQREKKKDWIYQKEIELKELEEKLNNREKIIRQKEIRLSQKFFLRSILFLGGLSAIGVFVVVGIIGSRVSPSGEINQTNNIIAKESITDVDTINKSSEYPLSIPSDPGTKYYVIGKEGSTDMPILITKRIGSSGTSYAKRVFDCQNQTTKYLGDGDSMAEMNSSSPSPRMGDIYPQSIAWYQWNHVCNN
jgi:hypothetical protein